MRFLAIIELKNGIDKYWRSRTIATKNAIPPEQKHMIRSNLFNGTLEEHDSQFALHNALVLAKVIRIDFPDEWPAALDNIIYELKTSHEGDNDHTLAGALLMLLQVVKELGTARLSKSQRALQTITPQLVQVLAEIYDAKTRLWLAFGTNHQGDKTKATVAMEISLRAFKILRRLLILGYREPHKDEFVQQIWSFSQSQFGQLLSLMNEEYPAIAKHILQFTKLHNEMASTHPSSFAALPGSSDLVRAYWSLVASFSLVFGESEGLRQRDSTNVTELSPAGPFKEKLALKGLLLMRSCIRLAHHPVQSIRYRSKEDTREQQEAIKAIKSQIFSDDFVRSAAETIITHLLVFRKSDMDAWEDDPQEWELQEENQGNAYEFEVRPCAERLFLDLFTHYKDLLLEPLLGYFNAARNPDASIAVKEAVYTTMGLAAAHIVRHFDFDDFLKSVIATDAAQTAPMCQILRRRIAILLSQWVPIKISSETRPLVYEIFKHLLNSQDSHNEIVVRITAARQLKQVVDEFEFDQNSFAIHAPQILKELINLVQLAEAEETKLAVVMTLRSIITRMDTTIVPFSELVMNVLPEIWSSAGDLGFMLKQAVMTILQSLVASMRSDFQRYQPLVLPLIAETTQEGSDSALHLIDEGLEFWHGLLQNSQPPLSPDLISLSSVAIEQLASQNDNAEILMEIVGCYIVLAPQSLLSDHYRQPLLKSLLASLDNKHRSQVLLTAEYVEITLRLSHQIGGEQGFHILMRDVVEVGFLKHLLEGIRDAYEAHQTSGPKRKQSRLDSNNLACYLTILARIAIIDPSTFVAMLGVLGPIESIWEWLSIEWFSNFDSMAEIDKLKLNLLGITRLLELPQPMAGLVLRKLQDYISMWTSVICQLWDDDSPGHDVLYTTDKIPTTEWDTSKDLARRELHSTDPIRTTVAYGFVKERLQGLANTVGEQTFQEWLANIDKDVLAGFQDLENRRPVPA
ncbi:hypothetical protein NPX13_g6432 [Xylaria arbuscula]|uniref:Importin N-terminal domain-containing protein n=1 Tax=Xylaria arbuscula TaxID=114810 RepID=A0A9W8NCM1_9PEZI|nr:hypothetical protein NPX13_g6432 [Xylaria arbuscula]